MRRAPGSSKEKPVFPGVPVPLQKEAARALQAQNPASVFSLPIWNFLLPDRPFDASTDVGDVSWVCPTGWFNAATLAAGTPAHTWQTVAQGKSGVAHKGMLFSAKVLASVGYEFLTDPALVQAAHDNWLEKLGGEAYPDPLPSDAKPEIW